MQLLTDHLSPSARRGLRFAGVTGLAALMLAASVATTHGQAPPHQATFDVLIAGARVGSETVTVTDLGPGWRVSATGRLAAPIDLVTNKFEVTYTTAWQPRQLTMSTVSHGQPLALAATFTPTLATVTMDRAGATSSVQHPVSPATLVIPANTFSAYEALAMRLSGAAVGTRWAMYVVDDAELSVRLDAVTPRRLTAPTGVVNLRRCDVTFTQSSGSVPAEVWIDADGHLARFLLPAQGLAVLRSDLNSVMMRDEGTTHAGDEQVFIPSNGFAIAATYTKPPGATGRLPVVVLVGSTDQQDRDETRAGVPVLGQLAGALVDAGYAVVRYDRRGTGQSGGRTELVTLSLYTDDLIQVVDWLAARKDIDRRRLVLAGYDDGGVVALLAAARQKSVRGVALLATPGRTGRQVVLDQQEQALDRTPLSEADRASRVALQKKVLDAVATGRGWESLAPEIRRASDTPWFRSWVLFDPAVVFRKVNQPVLIVQGSVDRQVPPADADALERIASARKPSATTVVRKVVMPGVNHLFVPAQTGTIEEYSALPSRTLSPQLAEAIASWLTDVVPSKK